MTSCRRWPGNRRIEIKTWVAAFAAAAFPLWPLAAMTSCRRWPGNRRIEIKTWVAAFAAAAFPLWPLA
ncbi:hypothetical protein CK247_31690, partial [Klebsiella pneumoniae]